MEAANIATALILIVLGLLIKHGKMYNAIAGYNTMSPQEKKKVDIVGFSTLMRNSFVIMGALIIAVHYMLEYFELFYLIPFVILIVVGIGIPVLLFRGRKYNRN